VLNNAEEAMRSPAMKNPGHWLDFSTEPTPVSFYLPGLALRFRMSTSTADCSRPFGRVGGARSRQVHDGCSSSWFTPMLQQRKAIDGAMIHRPLLVLNKPTRNLFSRRRVAHVGKARPWGRIQRSARNLLTFRDATRLSSGSIVWFNVPLMAVRPQVP